MKTKILLIILGIVFLACKPDRLPLDYIESEIKISTFRASDSTIISPVFLKIELMNGVDTSFIKYAFCDSTGNDHPYRFTNRDLQYGLYLISAYSTEDTIDIDTFKLVNFKPRKDYDIKLYLTKRYRSQSE